MSSARPVSKQRSLSCERESEARASALREDDSETAPAPGKALLNSGDCWEPSASHSG